MTTYDVERDIELHALERARNIAKGVEKTDAECRADGGVPISNRAAVLLHHYGRSYVAALTPGSEKEREAALFDAVTCSRRIIEYIGALEDATLFRFSDDPEDTVKDTIGLAAATLEKLLADLEAHYAGKTPPLRERRGMETFTAVTQRLRIIEDAITRIPGYVGTEAGLPLPVVP